MTRTELCRDEDAAWAELVGLLESLTPEQAEEPGYYPDWSVKDLMAHVASWQAEAEMAFQQMRNGTYRPAPLDVDELNRRFHEANRDQPLPVVRAELWAARTRMLAELNALPAVTEEAARWFLESGPEHYREHLPRLRQWVRELRSRGEPSRP